MEEQSQGFFIFFSLLSVVSIGAVHAFIRDKLGAKHDNGLLWVAAAMFVWFLMGLLEYSYASYSDSYLKAHYQEMWPYWYGRKTLSIFNSAFFVYSLSYFKEAWWRLNKRLEKMNLKMLAVITLGLCFATFPLEPRLWLLTDTVVSVGVALALCLSMAAIFYQRGMKAMGIFSLLVCFFLIYTQVTELLNDPLFSGSVHSRPFLNGALIRMLSRPALVVCILALAISWLGSQLEEEVVSRTPARQVNSLRFENRGIRHYVTISLQTEDISLQNKVFDFTHRPALFTFLQRCAERTIAGQNFHRDEFTDNLDTMIKRLLELLNQKMADEGSTQILQKADLFVREGKGLYRLAFAPAEIQL